MSHHEGSPSHAWQVASNVPIAEEHIKRALQRKSYRVPAETTVDVLEIICVKCRRPYDDVNDEPCVDDVNTEHLRGGPIGVRKKRGPLPAVADYRGQHHSVTGAPITIDDRRYMRTGTGAL